MKREIDMPPQSTSPNRRQILKTVATIGSLTSVAAAPAKLTSLSALAMAPDGKVIAADWKGGRLHAVALPPAKPQTQSDSYNIKAIDSKIAAALRVPLRQLRFPALAFDRVHGRAIVACDAGSRGTWLAVLRPDASISMVDASQASRASVALDDAPPDAALWEQIPARSFLVSCLECRANEVLAAGLANADFSSSLRRIPYPFRDGAVRSKVEAYHTIHNQIETRAPIRAFASIDLAGEPHLLAAYTCTPLVLIPLADLQNEKVRGKTIAELGYGNTPVSIVPFSIEYQGQSSRWVLVANSSKSADLISLEAIAAAAQKPGLSEPVRVPFTTRAGVPAIEAPLTGFVALVDQDPQFLLGMRRDTHSASLDLVSFRKGAFFRLSDHVNEYDFPNYTYPDGDAFQQQYVRPFHQLMRRDEGFPKLVK